MNPGTLHLRIPEGSHGVAKVIHDSPDILTRLRAARDGQPLNASKYTRLIVDGTLWMTDAEYECWTQARFVNSVHGDVLIAGLGLGLILGPMLKNKRVTSVTVLEISADVIALIGPRYKHRKLTIIEADVKQWQPPKKAYDFVYFDIWSDVPNVDNKREIADLKKRYRSSLKTGGQSTAWCEHLTRR